MATRDPDAYVRQIVTANPNMLVPHYLLASFLYYEADLNLISDEAFNELCHSLHTQFDAVEHPHKHLIDRDVLWPAGSGFYLHGKYPSIVKGAALALYRMFHAPRRPARKRGTKQGPV